MHVYFYCSDEPFNLQEDVVALAEGMEELGVSFHGNCNYWLKSTKPGDYLIKHDPAISPDECDAVVVSYAYPFFMRPKTFDVMRRPLPDGLFKKGRKYVTVYVDNHDGHKTLSWDPEYRQFDHILRSKLNRRAWHPENMRPWVLGFTNRIAKATAGGLPFSKRRKAVLFNFGASHPYNHGTRTLAAKTFLPQLEKLIPFDTTKDDLQVPPADQYERLMWEQTGMRFSRSYYDRLKNSQAVACFCGEMIPPMPWKNPGQYLVGGNKAKMKRAFYEALAKIDPRPPRSVQWDSFRAWEGWVAGCATINLDLDLYGPILPVMPENWKHYIGVDLGKPGKAVERLRDDPAILEQIAGQGQQWALEHYSPKAVAQRLLDTISRE
ncbi:MAG: glycosyltransferase family 1 protein [Chthoniobacterales bacterium]|nr:glycosyltransferase family 1 protein [Chthoniobacterales bacterium]